MSEPVIDKNMFCHPKPDFFRSKHRPYYIVTAEWNQKSAGTRVTFHLCHILNELGYEAYVVAQNSAKNLRTPLLTREIMQRHKEEGRKAISVYTDLMWGNTLETDIVVKWMTNREKLYSNAPHDYEALYFYYIKAYSDHKYANILTIPSVDRTIFNNDGVDNSKRDGFAYFAYKYLREGKGILPEALTSRGISLCKDVHLSSNEIADILRGVKALYVYEDTVLIDEAIMCGCPVVIAKTAFIAGMERQFEPYCKVIHEHEIDADTDTTPSHVLTDYYELYIGNAYPQLNKFIDITQKHSAAYTKNDPLLEYCRCHDSIYIYGGGTVGGMVFNALSVMEIKIEAFIISDGCVSENASSLFGVPVRTLSWLLGRYDDSCGVVLAMTKAGCEEIIPELNHKNVKYFC